MYRIIGEDGKEYGPVTLNQMQQWISQGRVRPKTRCQVDGSGQWRTAADIPEINQLFSGANPGTPGGKPKKGLAIAGLVLGVMSLVCVGPLAGIPAVICGHVARRRIQRQPGVFGGAGLALVGLILGYISIIATLAALPLLLKELKKLQAIDCQGNLQAVSVALQTWAMDHDNKFPFQVSTNDGGSLEWVASSADGDANAFRHFGALGQALETPKALVCPGDRKRPATALNGMTADSVSYRLFTGKDVSPEDPQSVVLACPIHGIAVTADGTLKANTPAK